MLLTKSTICKHISPPNVTVEQMHEKIQQLVDEGKTDGIYTCTVITDSVGYGVRNWVDEAAASEWIEFMRSHGDTNEYKILDLIDKELISTITF